MTQHQATSDQTGPLSEFLSEHLDKIMASGIEQGVFPGGVVLVRLDNEVVVHEAYGHSFAHQDKHSRLAEPIPTQLNTIYDLASITKVFTATCAVQLVDEKRIRLDDLVAEYLPDFSVNGKDNITVRQLLAHVTGLPNCRLWEEASTPEDRMRHVMTVTPEFPPGSAVMYHDTNLIVLGRLIEEVDGRRLDEAIQARVLGPLGLHHTRFGPLDTATSDVAATEDETYVGRGMVWGEVHDENAWSLNHVAGHAGLFSTARDLSVFGQMYLNGGTYGGARLLNPETVGEMTRNQVGDLGYRGLGWQLNASYYMSGLASPQNYGHTGFTGTSMVIDPQRELVVVILTNRVHPTRSGPKVDPVRRAIADAALEAFDTHEAERN